MSADLKHLNSKNSQQYLGVKFNSRISQTITRLYIFTVLAVLIGSSIALLQNWELRVKDTQSKLVRSANLVNFLIETNLAIAEKSLKTTQAAFTQALASGPVDAQLATQLLDKNYQRFKTYNNVDLFGLEFFVNAQGQLVARSGIPSNEKIDFSDRFYFYQLRDHPELTRAIGPLVFARTTKTWLFHISVPLHDKAGKFAGVLVQQLSETDIANSLTQYSDVDNFEQLMTHVTNADASFVFPPPRTPESPSQEIQQALKHRPAQEALTNGGAFQWNAPAQKNTKHVLMQVVKSSVYDLETYASFPETRIQHEFWYGNRPFFLFVLVGMSISTAIFFYLLQLSKKLTQAQTASLYDALTKVHNRRALDEILPVLLSDAMRSQEPISVLFIDIDHFRFFNKKYGHESGDTALVAVAQTLADCASRPLDFVCRWGGEEFVIVLPKTNSHAAQKIAHEILNAVRAVQLESRNGEHPSITVSVGYVTDTVTSIQTQDDLIDQADQAMRQAKSQGRDQCVAYEPIDR